MRSIRYRLYDADSQHRKLDGEKAIITNFNAATASSMKRQVVAPDKSCSMLIDLVKTKFSAANVVWSIPRNLISLSDWVSPGSSVPGAVDQLVLACNDPAPPVMDNQDVFGVVNARPERKKRLQSAHVEFVRSVVKLRRLSIFSESDHVFTVVGRQGQGGMVSIDIRTLATFEYCK